ncbi:peptide chain release factor N(5)-glutamine methyltransferase [Desulfovibrio litoralis]|uniref:Release factor glutamine methyltransferase n=1 Tax=Desulfovibrio litoralis DSM 11393 TaxID=1121455 RepID=A0A1M7SFG6_9BACT|nr:peptide chain release factor N(5)-glutamine methyltransferase [Desulfovibrio litoralis]SHN57032.1 release factor glutamine methyltransferase [Desulfovibrio litoralis DSM 11393]
MLNVKQLILQHAERLDALSVDSPRLSVELLFAHILQMSRSDLLKELMLRPGLSLEREIYTQALELLQRREQGEPIAYILGEKEFYGRNFKVNYATLIPRPETELIIDYALAYLKDKDIPTLTFADLGTGSGCLAITLSLELDILKNTHKNLKSFATALDISSLALATAKNNANYHKCSNILFCQSDLTKACLQPQKFNLIVSNPPYVSEAEYKDLDREVKNFEPYSALVSDQNGLALPFKAIETAAFSLKSEGLFLMEFGWWQGEQILNALNPEEWKDAKIIKDLSGLDRILFAVKA